MVPCRTGCQVRREGIGAAGGPEGHNGDDQPRALAARSTGVSTNGTANRTPISTPPAGVRRVGWLFVSVLGWTWGLLAVARLTSGSAPAVVGLALRVAAAGGPLLSTHVLMRRTLAYEQRTWFWRRYIEIRSVSRGWWVATVVLAGGPPSVAALADQSGVRVGWPGGVGLVLGAVALGLIQEAAWRGYAWDGLRRRPLGGTVVLWAGWVLWTAAWPVLGGLEGLHGVSEGWGGWSLLGAAMLPQTILMGWITVRVRPCLLPAALFDAVVLALWGMLDVGDRGRAVELVLWWVAAVPVLVSWWRNPEPVAGPVRSRR